VLVAEMLLLVGSLSAVITTPAQGQVSWQQYGNQTYCSNA